MRLWTRRVLAEVEEATVVAAIRRAEQGNLGEVRVHLENRCRGKDALERARQVFFQLGMDRTDKGTGVLLYVAVGDRTAAVFAGPGIHEAAEPSFWQEVVDLVGQGFAEKRPENGLVQALHRVGEILRRTVPGTDEAGNELPDEVSTS